MSERRARILVVDDDVTILGVVAEALRDEGYLVEEALNGAEALIQARRARPDAILLDLMMPVLDGWGFVEAFHREPEASSIPIVILSAANRLSETAQRLQSMGVRACLAKPFDLDVLLAVVDRLTRDASPA